MRPRSVTFFKSESWTTEKKITVLALLFIHGQAKRAYNKTPHLAMSKTSIHLPPQSAAHHTDGVSEDQRHSQTMTFITDKHPAQDTSEEGTQKETEDFFVIEDSSGSQVPLATAKEKFNEQPKMQ